MRTAWILVAVLAVNGCADSRTVKALEGRIEALEQEKLLWDARLKILEKVTRNGMARDAANFAVDDKGFNAIQSNYGPLFVSLESLTPYANGYKAVFDFGNPAAADFDGGEFEIWWGPALDFKKTTLAEWDKQTQHKTYTFSERLMGGTWNPLEVILAPATAGQIAAISINDIKLNKTVFLRTRR